MIDLTNKNNLTQEELETLRLLVEKHKELIQYVHHKYSSEFAFFFRSWNKSH